MNVSRETFMIFYFFTRKYTIFCRTEIYEILQFEIHSKMFHVKHFTIDFTKHK